MIKINKIDGVQIRNHNDLLCMSDLLIANINVCNEKHWSIKRVQDFFTDKDSFEYIEQILILLNKEKEVLSIFRDEYHANGLKSALKNIGLYKVTGRGTNKAIFCDSYVFIGIAQWLNPRFRAMVTKWVTDEFLLDRVNAGTQFNQLSKAISEHIVPKISDNAKKFIYSNFAKLINKKVFGEHSDNLRQIASKEQLQSLNKAQTKISALIEVGYISSYQDAKDYMNL